MCFSATANFVGSGVLGALGVATLSKVEHRRELLFAATPLLFAVHQFTEGFVWLGVDGRISPAAEHMWAAAFMLYAQGLLPVVMPLSIYLFEPNGKARNRMVPFLGLGVVLAVYMLWALTAFPFTVYMQEQSLVYIDSATNYTAIGALYVVATCGSLFFSRERPMVMFGAANLGILLTVLAVRRYAATSLWCAYAAAASILILGYFWKTSQLRGLRYA
jgi:cytochrome bd-type quinol oxidase subunit 2